MKIQLQIKGENASILTEKLSVDLFNSDLKTLDEVYRESSYPKEGSLGHDLLNTLNLVFTGSSFLLALVAFLREWLRGRKEDIDLTLNIDGKKVTVSGKDEKEIFAKIRQIEEMLAPRDNDEQEADL